MYKNIPWNQCFVKYAPHCLHPEMVSTSLLHYVEKRDADVNCVFPAQKLPENKNVLLLKRNRTFESVLPTLQTYFELILRSSERRIFPLVVLGICSTNSI